MKYLRYVWTTLLVAVIFGGYFYYLTFSGQIEQNPISNAIVAVARPYPALTNPKEVTLNCDYHGKNLAVSETLYGSLYDYYRTDPAKKSAYLHSKDKDFVFSYAKDGTIKDLANKIDVLGVQNGLSNDQKLDLSSCLMQGIPYDEAKAARILGTDFAKQPLDLVIPRYPYETLYDNTGICTDKTYLGAAVLDELGYETAILTFDAQKHMSLGVAVPEGFGSFGTKYGIMELTGNGFVVGDVPELNASAGLAVGGFQTIPQADGNTPAPANQLKLDNPSGIEPAANGNVYERIVERTAIRQKLEQMKPQLEVLQTSYKNAKTVLDTAEADLKTAEDKYKAQKTQDSYNQYTASYNRYISAYNDAQGKINEYNRLVNLYNSYVAQYQQF